MSDTIKMGEKLLEYFEYDELDIKIEEYMA